MAEGDEVVPVINRISSKFDKVVATQDWHPIGHVSFASTHKKSPFDVIDIGGVQQTLWPDHCVPGTFGADLHRDLDMTEVDLIIRKGTNLLVDSYSAFLENDKKTETGLRSYLQGLGLTDLYVAGLATDYCVYYSALDALDFGFRVSVILDAAKGVDVPAGNVERAIEDMKKRGIRIVNHDAI